MKLPAKISQIEIAALHASSLRTAREAQDVMYEAIVRDCATVAEDAPQLTYEDGQIVKNAILARYGLTESPTEQLVAERVGLRGPHVG